jgi:hypothetical protein
MDNLESSPVVGMFRGTVSVGDACFSVMVEVTEAVAGVDVVDQAIVGLAGDSLRRIVKYPSEAVFVDEIEPASPNEDIPGRLDEPLENPNWLPGVRILAIQRL